MSSLAANATLIAPLDLMRFTSVYLALLVVPGYSMATLARPGASRIERLVLATPCAYTLVTLCALATALLHRAFDVPVYLILAIPVTVAGGWRMRFRPPTRGTGRGLWYLVPAGVACVQLGEIALVYRSSSVPSSNDALTHVVYIAQFLHTHHVPLALFSGGHGHDAGAGFYPPIYHVATALVLSLVPMPPYEAAFFSVMACAAVLPLGLFACTRAVTGSARLGGLATLGALAFEQLPLTVLAKGLYPFIAAQMFVPAFALAAIAAVRRKDSRAVALVALLGVGLFYTHPTELLTAVLLALAAAPAFLRGSRSWRRAGACAVACAAVWGIAALPALNAIHQTVIGGAQSEIKADHFFLPPAHIHPGAILNTYLYWTYTRNLGYALVGLILIGGVWCLARRRYIPFVVVVVVLFVVFMDSSTYNVLRRLYILSYPWSLFERLSPTNYWFALPLAAIGADVTFRFLQPLCGRINRTLVGMLAALAILLGLVLPLDTAAADVNLWAARNNAVLPTDVAALNWLAHHAPPNTVVVNDAMIPSPGADPPVDAGIWIQALVNAQPLFTRAATGPGSLADRLDLLAHVGDVPLPARDTHFINRYRVRYVFCGSTVRVLGKRRLDLRRLLAAPYLHLVYSGAATCRDHGAHGPTVCPATAAYVFALNLPSHATGR